MKLGEFGNHLAMARDAVRRLRARMPEVSELVDLNDVLDRLVVEAGPLQQARQAAARDLAELVGTKGSGSYEEEAAAVESVLANSALTDEAFAHTVHAILLADRELWTATIESVGEALAESRATTASDAAPVRSVDASALSRFINDAAPGEGSVCVTQTVVASEGASKMTLFISLEGARTLPSEMVLRMDQPFNYLGTSVRDEVGALKLLHAHGAPVPAIYIAEMTGDVLGQPFLLMERLQGAMLGKIYFPPEQTDHLTSSIAAALARLHAVPIPPGVQIGAARDDDRAFIEQEMKQYEATWRALEASCPTVDAALLWSRRHIADAIGIKAIVHNDFNYHNIIVDDEKVTGVIDWEFVHVGNPAADVCYFQDSADRAGGFAKFIDDYVQAGGTKPTQAELDFYTVWGHLRLAIMSFQVEVACRQGKFRDIRYALYPVHFMMSPILALSEQLARILKRDAPQDPP